MAEAPCIIISPFHILQENGDLTPENGSDRALQYPFSVNEKVVIKVNYFPSASLSVAFANIWMKETYRAGQQADT